MTNFSLITAWNIPAPLETVWNTVLKTEAWPSWWKYVKSVEELQPGNKSGINNIRRYTWKTCLPYQLTLDLCVTRLEPYHIIETDVSGDLAGEGRCQLSTHQGYTKVRYEWNVHTCKPWMNWLSPIARTVFEWNHHQVMKNGENSLIQYLDTHEK